VAGRETRRNRATVTPIASHISTISANASPYAPAPKNSGVQIALSTSWTTQAQTAGPKPARRQTSQPAIAMSA